MEDGHGSVGGFAEAGGSAVTGVPAGVAVVLPVGKVSRSSSFVRCFLKQVFEERGIHSSLHINSQSECSSSSCTVTCMWEDLTKLMCLEAREFQ